MSAYGDIKRTVATSALPTTIWTRFSPQNANTGESGTDQFISVHHLTLGMASALPGLLGYLGTVFAKEIEDGLTYPQEGEMEQKTFEAYFFAADVFVGIVGESLPRTASGERVRSGDQAAVQDIDAARGTRTWEECVAGYYYIKPNYPGRSSHICNAGFVVPPVQRKKGYGSLLSQSYVHYAPRLGYQGSVFNLVYVNNVASVRLWEKLGFTKVGRIPRAGRLRTADGQGEEYVDAWVVYKSFY
ncbi:N-acetyltransferase aca1 [Psilocybe cubensis]|uniref:N-acetyltransferase aca1 n=2 Tax=Psilocybe cubensis TaxID=181762 RepID=A0ACB8HCC3_PSICU|nr:N-acetyltransferase aca1 [Psilocybe cubensis]KAH9485521.1 N-acetyltransferase aca1 [Psilocybe cubensis]